MKAKGVDACKALSIMPSLTVFLEKTETEDAFFTWTLVMPVRSTMTNQKQIQFSIRISEENLIGVIRN